MESEEENFEEIEEENESEEEDEDDELEAAMASTTLYDYKKGLVRPLVPKKTFINDMAGLNQGKKELEEKHSSWLERMDLNSSVVTIQKKKNSTSSGTGSKKKEREANNDEHGDEVDIENDFSREMHFVRQAQASLLIGLSKLKELDIPTVRPEDYFAEMIKTDDHMRKVRERLLSRHKRIEASEKAKKLRDMKKYGKKVQENVLDQRRKEKKELLQKVKKYSKGKGEKPEFLRREDDEEFPTKVVPSTQRKERRGPMKSKKRLAKDKKFSFSSFKKDKRNTAESSADMRMFPSSRTGGRGQNKSFGKGKGGKKGGGPKPRPGKSNRARQKLKRRNRH
ncbi:PREDICTED: probable rRNA-processing protein EBP2 [Amphimedon queenslandica]|uniref:Uncharacterized protein n=1 Tax=Amphimedon queenslandica TaxID=400682 RepID=A0A1X7UC03_AMPQE|nr:PREDICTED: probable rRNA-processing protein EBP2 [Amphimedon queenslandica]|eukprot:XP_003388417.3 PREDICTED: probable rRNA-processing protein EBP2 [Amphimedon queenslandica]